MVAAACDGIQGVSESQLELKSNIQLYDGIRTSDVQETLIKAAADLISEETPNYQYVAGRLINFDLRKKVWGSIDPPSLYDHVRKLVDQGFYDPGILEWYTREELEHLGSYIDHDRDLSIVYAGMEQFRGKYLVRNRITKKFLETPGQVYMMIAATLFGRYPRETRMRWVKDYYDAISEHYLSLPTPVMAGVRTPMRQFSSCVLIESGDSLDSICQTATSIVNYVAQRAGIGIGAGSIRAEGSPVRKGDTLHTGVVPFYKFFQSAVKSSAQGGVRGGSATLNVMIWHLEIENILVLKNNKGTEDTRARHMDYCIQFSKLFYERLLQNGNITLFSPSEVPGLYEAFFSDQKKFEELYKKAEKNTKIRKKVVKARDLFSLLMKERKETGRIYFMHVDHVNDRGPYKPNVAPVKMTNLCCEVVTATRSLTSDPNNPGLIGLCTLSAINWGKFKRPSEMKHYCRLAVRGLNAILDFQDFPVPQAEAHTRLYRPLGVGIINLAYWLVKNGLNYQDIDEKGLSLVQEWAEAWSYYLIEASVEEAGERGRIDGWCHTRWSYGLFPKDYYKKEVDELVPNDLKMDWDSLREVMLRVGIRNANLTAIAPTETSSQISNATNGIEPPRALVSVKESKDGVLKQVVPEIRKLGKRYDLLWDQKSPEGYIKIVAVFQKFVDQSISANMSYNPEHYPDYQVPLSELLKHQVMAYKYGHKTGYYMNTKTVHTQIQEEDERENCDSCVI
jgi:ribonucleoside-diphosphate reductase alpha chain